MEDIWAKLHKRIEDLIETKISQSQLDTLKKKLLGLQSNMRYFSGCVKDYQSDIAGGDPDQQKRSAATLHMAHVGFREVIQAAMPEFRTKHDALPTAVMFTAAANIHVILLADGIHQGEKWGYSKSNIKSMQADLKRITGRDPMGEPDNRDALHDRQFSLKMAIMKGKEMNVPANVLDTWKEAYAGLLESGPSSNGEYDNLSYVSYVNKLYELGYRDVKIPDWVEEYLKAFEKGWRAAGAGYKARLHIDYFRCMGLHGLNYAEIWPHLDSREVPLSSKNFLDREIFFGPYGDCGDVLKWTTLDSTRLAEDRTGQISGIRIRAWDDLDAMQIQYFDGTFCKWAPLEGNDKGGELNELELPLEEEVPWERFTSVDVWCTSPGEHSPVGRLFFRTNKGRSVGNGMHEHGYAMQPQCSIPGYELTSAKITDWRPDAPTGCLGIVLGFRPLSNSGRPIPPKQGF
ncbi:delta endotoxin [Penicillium brevicompactum]|uniref:Delta endotoxin n=1 Tax=Penicillium brevicompactum TaxID=5074 RepID=A0A9W9UIV1_PENBR|nr:delta endotoxin [Penicillium brevicompactum]